MEYFYAPPANISGNTVVIEAEEFAHLTHVMRKSVGDRFVVVDGKGTAHLCRLQSLHSRSAHCAIEESHPGLHEPTLNLTVAVALLKHPASMDYVVEKLTEVGAGSIVPMRTSRTVPQHERSSRWQKISLAAMKQSGRCVLPSIEPLTTFAEVLEKSSGIAWKFIPHERVVGPFLRDVSVPGDGRVVICIGPEGGFTEEEIDRAVVASFQPVTLGNRRLRTETAAVVAAATLLR